MTAFLALYRGETVSGARIVALTADPALVRDFAAKLVGGEEEAVEEHKPDLRLLERDHDDKGA